MRIVTGQRDVTGFDATTAAAGAGGTTSFPRIRRRRLETARQTYLLRHAFEVTTSAYVCACRRPLRRRL